MLCSFDDFLEKMRTILESEKHLVTVSTTRQRCSMLSMYNEHHTPDILKWCSTREDEPSQGDMGMEKKVV